jgi:hypothetical protein
MKSLKVVACDIPMSLVDCPPGLFLFGMDRKSGPSVGIKTEYGAHNPHNMEVFCVDSGEVFWGGVDSKSERSDLIVTPAKLEMVEE